MSSMRNSYPSSNAWRPEAEDNSPLSTSPRRVAVAVATSTTSLAMAGVVDVVGAMDREAVTVEGVLNRVSIARCAARRDI